jgi:transcriptional regulator with XRE-family HTH domain
MCRSRDSPHGVAVIVRESLDLLRGTRRSKRLDTGRLGQRLGYHPDTIRRWERGVQSPSLNAFVDWANALGYVMKLERVEHS